MKLLVSLLFMCTAALTSCNNSTKSERHMDASASQPDTSKVIKEKTYTYTQQKDTAILKLYIAGQDVNGTLSYNLYEKDKNDGAISGTVHGDTILADYTFSAEGIQSVRQVAFLKRSGQLVEATGETEEKDNKTVFKTPHKLKYNSGIIFKPAD